MDTGWREAIASEIGPARARERAPQPAISARAAAVDRPGASWLRSLAAALVHDLRNPLGAISGEIEVTLRRERSAEEYRAALSRIDEQVSQLVALTSDIALVSDTHAQDPVFGPFPESELLAGVAALAPPAGSLSIEGTRAGLHLIGEPTRLSRALALLVEYALGHRRAGATVRVYLFPDPGSRSRARIRIEATSPGFVLDSWRDLGSPDGSSTRLRLRIARRLIEQGGGALRCDAGDQTNVVDIDLQCVEVAPPVA